MVMAGAHMTDPSHLVLMVLSACALVEARDASSATGDVPITNRAAKDVPQEYRTVLGSARIATLTTASGSTTQDHTGQETRREDITGVEIFPATVLTLILSSTDLLGGSVVPGTPSLIDSLQKMESSPSLK